MKLWRAVLTTVVTCAPVFAQWELGAVGGYGFRLSNNVEQGGATATVKFDRNYAFGFYGGLNEYGYLAGEARYLYENMPIRLSSGGTETTFSGHAQTVHFDILIHTARQGAAVRPFVAVGGGVKIYDGTGQDTAYQPLSQFLLLTRRQQTVPVFSPAVGVKFRLTEHIAARGEFRYYGSGRPDKILVPAPGATMSGWIHDFVPLFGIGATF